MFINKLRWYSVQIYGQWCILLRLLLFIVIFLLKAFSYFAMLAFVCKSPMLNTNVHLPPKILFTTIFSLCSQSYHYDLITIFLWNTYGPKYETLVYKKKYTKYISCHSSLPFNAMALRSVTFSFTCLLRVDSYKVAAIYVTYSRLYGRGIDPYVGHTFEVQN